MRPSRRCSSSRDGTHSAGGQWEYRPSASAAPLPESCDRAVASPDQYGSGTRRASDYGDLIKGALGCQPMLLRRTRSGAALFASQALIRDPIPSHPYVPRLPSRRTGQWSPGRRTRPAPVSASASRRCAAIRSSSCCAWSRRSRTRCSLSNHRSRRTDASINRSSSS
jgi:hypothetical protein